MFALDELKQHLRITGTEEDAYIAKLEAAAVQFVETQTGRYFGPVRSVTEYRRGFRQSLVLRNPPDGPVTVLRRYTATSDSVALADTEYAVRGRQLIRPSGWGAYEYEVTYTTGYTMGMEPADIRDVVRKLVAMAFHARSGIDGQLSEDMKATLQAYNSRPHGVA
jgi:hypothetical protein